MRRSTVIMLIASLMAVALLGFAVAEQHQKGEEGKAKGMEHHHEAMTRVNMMHMMDEHHENMMTHFAKMRTHLKTMSEMNDCDALMGEVKKHMAMSDSLHLMMQKQNKMRENMRAAMGGIEAHEQMMKGKEQGEKKAEKGDK